jgi:hypothetical protein
MNATITDREGEGGLDEPAAEGVHPATEVALHQADGGTQRGAEQRRERRDDQDVPGADDDPGDTSRPSESVPNQCEPTGGG